MTTSLCYILVLFHVIKLRIVLTLNSWHSAYNTVISSCCIYGLHVLHSPISNDIETVIFIWCQFIGALCYILAAAVLVCKLESILFLHYLKWCGEGDGVSNTAEESSSEFSVI